MTATTNSILCWRFLLSCWNYALCFPIPIMPKIDAMCTTVRLVPIVLYNRCKPNCSKLMH